MEVFNHDLESLFQQLGLPSDSDSICDFIRKHKLNEEENICTASFWSASQIQFLEEAKLQDADWVEHIDTLDSLLRIN